MLVQISLLGDQQISRELRRVGHRAGNLRPAWNKIADDLMDWTKAQFSSEGARASGGWDALADSTVARRGSAHPILQDTGAMFGELTDRGRIDISDDFLHVPPPSDDVDYAGYHQTGTVNMPQRRPFEFTEQDRRSIMKDLQRFIMTGAV